MCFLDLLRCLFRISKSILSLTTLLYRTTMLSKVTPLCVLNLHTLWEYSLITLWSLCSRNVRWISCQVNLFILISAQGPASATWGWWREMNCPSCTKRALEYWDRRTILTFLWVSRSFWHNTYWFASRSSLYGDYILNVCNSGSILHNFTDAFQTLLGPGRIRIARPCTTHFSQDFNIWVLGALLPKAVKLFHDSFVVSVTRNLPSLHEPNTKTKHEPPRHRSSITPLPSTIIGPRRMDKLSDGKLKGQ